MNEATTIFAPATPVSESSITVIRLSGPNTYEIISLIFSNEQTFVRANEFIQNRAYHGYILDNKELIDEVILTFYKSPNSFTGEDIAEISIHGGYYLYQRVSELLIKHGAKFAEAGEFTKRAFMNNKMDLVQAESIADIIKARTELSHKAALKQLTGEFSKEIEALRNELINYCSLVELDIDFSEEDIDVIDYKTLLKYLDKVIQKIDKITQTYESGRLIKDGINITIVGKPNVGKSSIFNFMLKENRAIVSEIPGTTRDYISEKLILGGYVFNLVDTAGIRESLDSIEKEGVKRSYEKVTQADIIIEVLSLEETEKQDGHFYRSNPYIKVFNKCDIVKDRPQDELCISAVTGENMEKLMDNLIEKARSLVHPEEISEIIITNERHRNKLLNTLNFLNNTKKLIDAKGGNELISIEIRSAFEELTEIIGKTTSNDILNNIFSKFCIGK